MVGEGDGSVHQVDAETLLPVGARARVDDDVVGLVWAGNGTVLALVEADLGYLYRVVDLADGSTGAPQFLGVAVAAADVSPDGRAVALGSHEGEIAIASVDTAEWLLEPTNVHTGSVHRVEFSADGSLLVSGSDDGRIRLWDGRTGAPRGSLDVAPAGVPSYASFLEDGHTLMITAGDGSVRRWDMRADRWVEHACARAGRSLTSAEWATIVGDDTPYRRTCPTA
jgi:WD40 repeat protein